MFSKKQRCDNGKTITKTIMGLSILTMIAAIKYASRSQTKPGG